MKSVPVQHHQKMTTTAGAAFGPAELQGPDHGPEERYRQLAGTDLKMEHQAFF